MCLYISKKSSKNATSNDLICYKVMFPINSTQALSQFKSYIYELGLVNYTPLIREGEDACDIVCRGFHSYKYYEDAVKSLDAYGVCGSAKVYKCIIPKKSLYYYGIQASTSDYVVGYCSNQIIIQEIVEDASVRSNRIIRCFDKFKTENPIWYYWLKIIGFGLLFALSVMILSTYLKNN